MATVRFDILKDEKNPNLTGLLLSWLSIEQARNTSGTINILLKIRKNGQSQHRSFLVTGLRWKNIDNPTKVLLCLRVPPGDKPGLEFVGTSDVIENVLFNLVTGTGEFFVNQD